MAEAAGVEDEEEEDVDDVGGGESEEREDRRGDIISAAVLLLLVESALAVTASIFVISSTLSFFSLFQRCEIGDRKGESKLILFRMRLDFFANEKRKKVR